MQITTATKITIARIFLIVPTVIMFIVAQLIDNRTAYIALLVVSAALFAVCCATDFVDGHIARKTGTVSDLGKLLDPLADKVIIVVMLFLIVLFKDGLDGVFAYNSLVVALLSGLILSRELLIGVFRSIAAGKGLILAADIFGKIKTTLLDFGVTALMLSGLHIAIAYIGTILFYLGAVVAVFSGVNYMVKNSHVLKDGAKADKDDANTCDDGEQSTDAMLHEKNDGEQV